jgi:hypothetical protein
MTQTLMQLRYAIAPVAVFLLMGCNTTPDPNVTVTGEDELTSLELHRELSSNDKKFEEVVYVPIYSDIYINRLNQKALLSATLSIRNTSLSDSLFVSTIDYYNTEGQLVKNFIKHPIGLAPMATVNYVIEKEDTSGGSGANFIVKLNSDKDINPLIEAIMIADNGNKSFAFSVEGYTIE